MANSFPSLRRFWHQVRVRPRLVSSILTGLLMFPILPASLLASTRALIAWDTGAWLYLAMAWIMMSRATMAHMRERARQQDDGAPAVLFLTVAAALASLAAIVVELSGLKDMTVLSQGSHLAIVAATFLASWLLVHSAFALHYAHAYYISVAGETGTPLEFPGRDAPVYLDFLYFAVVIGMTSQTADVAIANTRMRRLVMAQGLISFVFNTTLLALTINIAASLLG